MNINLELQHNEFKVHKNVKQILRLNDENKSAGCDGAQS